MLLLPPLSHHHHQNNTYHPNSTPHLSKHLGEHQKKWMSCAAATAPISTTVLAIGTVISTNTMLHWSMPRRETTIKTTFETRMTTTAATRSFARSHMCQSPHVEIYVVYCRDQSCSIWDWIYFPHCIRTLLYALAPLAPILVAGAKGKKRTSIHCMETTIETTIGTSTTWLRTARRRSSLGSKIV